MQLLNSLYYCQGGHENSTCFVRPWQLGQQALWEFINLGGHLHSTLTDESGENWLTGLKLLNYVLHSLRQQSSRPLARTRKQRAKYKRNGYFLPYKMKYTESSLIVRVRERAGKEGKGREGKCTEMDWEGIFFQSPSFIIVTELYYLGWGIQRVLMRKTLLYMDGLVGYHFRR